MGPRTLRARKTEAALINQQWNDTAIDGYTHIDTQSYLRTHSRVHIHIQRQTQRHLATHIHSFHSLARSATRQLALDLPLPDDAPGGMARAIPFIMSGSVFANIFPI